MTKRFLPIILTAGMSLCGMATTLQPNEALSRFMLSKPAKIPGLTLTNPQLEVTEYAADGTPTLYVFNLTGSPGYIVLSADDQASPLLGYSDKGEFNPNSMPPSLKYWLNAYSRQINHLRTSALTDTINGGGYTGVTLPQEWTPVTPLLTTTWNQTQPYNDLCPEYRGEKSVTGCVATAMAQTINYFKYPEVGRDSVKYRVGAIKANLKYNFEEHYFDWENMLDTYVEGTYNETEANAVADLMLACGMSVKMMYSPEASGAYSQNIPTALIKYFNYDEGTTILYRDYYSYTQWAEMIYNNLKNVGPVIYDGQAPLQGGHSFVCDGYDGNGYFHFNWGWGGLSDGYFLLDALTPEAIGTGGYYGGFSLMQDIILGIQPPKEVVRQPVQKRALQYGSLIATADKLTIYLGAEGLNLAGWGYMGPGTAHFDFGVIIENTDDASAPDAYLTTLNYYDVEIDSGLYIPFQEGNFEAGPQIQIEDLGLLIAGQKYKLTFATKDLDWFELTGEEPEWLPVTTTYGFPNYVYITMAENGTVLVEDASPAMFSISNVVVPGQGYYDKPLEFMLNISNENDFELSRNICAGIVNEETMNAFMTDSFLITLAPGETITYKWTSPLTQIYGGRPQNGQVYEFGFIDIANMWQYETDPIFITMEYEGAGINTVGEENTSLNVTYDMLSNSITVASENSLSSLTASSVNGVTVSLPITPATVSTSISLDSLTKGVWIIKATDSKGQAKALKIII